MLASKSVSQSNDHNLIAFIASTVEKLRDDVAIMREQMATKDDLARLKTTLQGDIEQVQLRLDGIEHGMKSRFENVEGELSRLRSAIYILGRDRPEVLRLLGQNSG